MTLGKAWLREACVRGGVCVQFHWVHVTHCYGFYAARTCFPYKVVIKGRHFVGRRLHAPSRVSSWLGVRGQPNSFAVVNMS